MAVSGLNSSQSPSPAIGVIHSLKAASSARISIIGLAYDMLLDGSYSLPLADQIVELPFPVHHPEQFLKKLAAFTAKVHIDCLIPTIDAEVAVISRLEADLQKLGIRVLLPRENSLKAISKERLTEWPPIKPFNLPPSVVAYSRNDILPYSRQLDFPLILKGPLGEARQAYSVKEAGVYFDLLAKTWGTPIILQKFIPGEEYALACLADQRSEAMGIVVMKKIIQVESGTTWAGVTVQEPKLMEIAPTLLQHLKWVGPLELEFIKETASGRYYLLEVNNRFPAWIYLAAMAGQNMPLSYVKLAMGRKVRPFDSYQSGKLYVRIADDLVTDFQLLANLMSKREWNGYEEKEKRSLRKTVHRPALSKGRQ